ncbi:MAG: hypothetical protein HOJ79_09000 [Nitrospina sp.]|nr:hypothetical protein [Nitrospina sp.]
MSQVRFLKMLKHYREHLKEKYFCISPFLVRIVVEILFFMGYGLAEEVWQKFPQTRCGRSLPVSPALDLNIPLLMTGIFYLLIMAQCE